MRVLAFSDLHCNLDQAAVLTEKSTEADVVIGAGDFANVHEGLNETIEALSGIERPSILVPGNNETLDALNAAVRAWPAAAVLHGDGTEIDGVPFFGLGGGIPITPWDWSFDLDESLATEMLASCPADAVLVLHSPPKGHCDGINNGHSFGSQALLEAIELHQPRLAVCGHIHEAWGERSRVGPTPIANLGPEGVFFDL